ncbi:hypothetical protein [Mammaliicoccus sp. F-M27]|uniref:hypothetical protein n=1 Tax=Mammaliicoccus sp. F-M27 TaxID=2898687 RepID=UPI001EFA3F49|nr:hypothetical protein [Mammaliicoccus sp. F-M27]
MGFKINPTSSTSMLYKIYITLRDKERTAEEDMIFQMINDKYGEKFSKSSSYYYQEHKHKAKVTYSGFYSRINKGWSWEEAIITPAVKDNPYNNNRPKGKTMEQIQIEERESDIISMMRQGLPLTKKQRKYVEENTSFANRLRSEV